MTLCISYFVLYYSREDAENVEDEPVEQKEESESVKALKKGAGLVGGFFKKGWGAVKSGAQKANEKFKETEVVIGSLCLTIVWKEDCCRGRQI